MPDGLLCSFSGYLGQDAMVRYTQSGQPLCQFSVLVADSKRKDEEAQRWIRVTLWGEDGEQLAPALTKGSEVHVLGFTYSGAIAFRSGRTRPPAPIGRARK